MERIDMANVANFPHKSKPAAPGLRSGRSLIAHRIRRQVWLFCLDAVFPAIFVGGLGFALFWILLALWEGK